MNALTRISPAVKTTILLIAFVCGQILIGLATVFLPQYWVTALIAFIVFIIVMSYPMVGVSLMLISLYFPILPAVPLGALEFSASALPAAGLALGTFFRARFQVSRVYLANWQKAILALLALVFLLASLFSTDYDATIRIIPNMLIYLIILFGIMVEVNTLDKLRFVAKVILVLAFLLSIWRVELRVLRGLFGLPSLGINGAAFSFHPGIVLALIILLFTPGREAFSLGWRWFAGITLMSLLIHGVQYETRAAWVAWILILLVLLSRVYWERWLRYIPIYIMVGLMAIVFYGPRIEANYRQTLSTLLDSSSGNYSAVNSDDRVRLFARDAGWHMFQERPVLGWGPNRFNFLKPSFVSDSSKEAAYPGAFNSWLIMLVEMGLVGMLSGLIISLTALGITWYLLGKEKSPVNFLAFGFALGVLGLVVHLLFIDLMFSFYWIHVGLALAATRLALENKRVQENT